ncbi:Pycsar system effector family protein [Actinomadura scrupuli]|uniref:Pycsar system effector family protein n=1 Tax=Actinomadura scrupuli TaxID=559629 RepID=UPI003D96734E
MAMVLAALSALSALAAVYPRIPMVKPVSMLYFDHVSRHKDAAEYHTAAMDLFTEPDLLARALTDQIWAFSRQARRKYTHVMLAMVLLGASACLGLPTLIFI